MRSEKSGNKPNYHDTKTQAERRRQERIAILYPEVAFAWKFSDDYIDADYGSPNDACCRQC